MNGKDLDMHRSNYEDDDSCCSNVNLNLSFNFSTIINDYEEDDEDEDDDNITDVLLQKIDSMEKEIKQLKNRLEKVECNVFHRI